jgi:energy-converting hydrogenase B subunit Q
VAGGGRRGDAALLSDEPATLAISVTSRDEPGVLYRVAEVIFLHGANITYVGMTAAEPGSAGMQFEIAGVRDREELLAELRNLDQVIEALEVPSFLRIFGKRVIVIGGGAQVGMVAQGAIAEADRHNIRGERISVDTIPLVGEEGLAESVRAVARLHRARILVLAGALMGGDISNAVREVQQAGIIVVSTSMAGSVPEAADLVVTDPLEAGVMAVMLIADTAQFSIDQVRGKRF